MLSKFHFIRILLLIIAIKCCLGDDASQRRSRQLFLKYPPYFYPSYNSLYLQSLNNRLNSYGNSWDVESRLLSNGKLSWNGLLNEDEAEVEEGEVKTRQNLFGLSNINSAVNPFASIFNRLPFIRNPDSPSLTNVFAACQDTSGLAGICVPSLSCTSFGGKPSGSCGLGTVCCVNAVSKCGGQVTLNNTYWTSPTVISSGMTCGLTLTLDNNLIEQKRKICQVRLDFISFTLEQPNAQTVCAVDNFQVVGASNQVPVICGNNANQHMYLNPPSSVTDLQLLFTFGQSTIARSWNIKISLLPCLASYLAPKDCLQYYTEASGMIRSFNWQDVTVTATAPRQLANQNYKICFRTELVSNMVASRICYTKCAVTNGGNPFSLSLPAAADTSQVDLGTCSNDFLIIPAGFDPAVALTTATNTWDRYCGQGLNPLGNTLGSVTVCSTVKGFSLTYRTNGDEATEAGNVVNTGFCLDFQQRIA